MGVGVGVVCAPHVGRCPKIQKRTSMGTPGAGDIGHCDWPDLGSAN